MTSGLTLVTHMLQLHKVQTWWCTCMVYEHFSVQTW
ncbi:hypothetical protein AALP_AA7G140900 [Arabis alpina]|uniref:Uncharacterized protein n=1 Tax=Arabis alpina TaxID=50452 RepID=A0A087GHY6_ARAAL|nr:hypothetical protein AALP_AA7G140900 [Arabis alpina]